MTHPTRPAPPGGFCIAAYLMPSPILIAPSIDGSRSKATSCKPDTPVLGGA